MHRTLSSTTVSSAQDIRDLRDALAFLSTLPGHHLSTTSKAVDAPRVRQFIGKNRQFRNAAPAFIGVSAPIF